MKALLLLLLVAPLEAWTTSMPRGNSHLTTLFSFRRRGLEQRRERATPSLEDELILYCKAGPDGTSIGDCPFCHWVRLVMEEMQLPYTLKPCTADSKPTWLVDHYEGKMPALRHGRECYVESSVIVSYLDFFFDNSLPTSGQPLVDGFFPAVAKYLKTANGSAEETERLAELKSQLQTLNEHVDASQITLQDCRLAPQLHHMVVAGDAYKTNPIQDFPRLEQYYQEWCERPSFQKTLYPPETIVWGWGNARQAAGIVSK